ncbi:MAG: hypothetical protein GC160_28995 [Acidobacteria bacterium]|nr:hypothetical protein [Acidobacteriota bacterium]
MKAFCAPSGRRIAPFLDPMGEVQILGRDLAEYQREELIEAGLEPVSEVPVGEPYLLYSDRTWFSRAAVQRFVAQAQAPARLRVEHAQWLELTGPLQRWDEPGVYEMALLPAGAPPSFESAPPVTIDLQLQQLKQPAAHPAMAHAAPSSVPVGEAGIHQIDHWLHILRANWLAAGARRERAKGRFARAGAASKAAQMAQIAWRMRSWNKFGLAAALSRFGPGCQIHPTAVVEASLIGANVVIGPFSVVRGATVCDGVEIGEHASINGSVIGAGCWVSRRATANLCVLYPGVHLSAGDGFQACIFGRDAFVAWSSTVFDLSFGAPIKVYDEGRRVSAGTHFLGAAVGHRSRLGGKVILGYGSETPNDSFLVSSSGDVLRAWEEGPSPHRVEGGVARPVRREKT